MRKAVVSEGEPMQGDDLVMVVEATKMEQPLVADKTRVVTNLSTAPGDNVAAGTLPGEIRGEIHTATP